MSHKSNMVIYSLIFGTIIFGGCTKQDQPQTIQEQRGEYYEISQAIKDGKGAHCTFSQIIDEQEHKMEYWFKADKIKVAGLNDPSQQNQYAHMINNGQEMYMWGDDNIGIKWHLEDQELAEDNQYEPNIPDFSDDTQIEDYQNKGFNVNCQQQNLDDEFFNPPTSIQFQNMEMMMENAFGQMKQEMIQEQSQDELPKMMDSQKDENDMQQYQLMMQQYQEEE